MKRFLILFFLIELFISQNGYAQSPADFGSGYFIDYTTSGTPCIHDNAGVLTYGDNMNQDAHIVNEELVLSSPSSIGMEGCPSWFGIPIGTADGSCKFMHDSGAVAIYWHAGGMSDYVQFWLRGRSDVDGAKIRFYVGSIPLGGGNFPSSSTWHTEDDKMIIAEFVLSTTTTEPVYCVTSGSGSSVTWDNWADNNFVNVVGYDLQTPSANYYISQIFFGKSTMTSPYTNNAISSTHSNSCGTAVNIPLGVYSSTDASVKVVTEPGGHIQIDQSFIVDKVMVTDMFGRTEEFSSNDFYTQLRGVLMVSCVSGNKIKNAKVIMN